MIIKNNPDLRKLAKAGYKFVDMHLHSKHSPDCNTNINEIVEIANKKYVPYPSSRRIAMKDCFEDAVPEIIVKEDISLFDNENFLGFYIRGEVPKDIKSWLLKRYSGKILFDGKKIKLVRNLR